MTFAAAAKQKAWNNEPANRKFLSESDAGSNDAESGCDADVEADADAVAEFVSGVSSGNVACFADFFCLI